MKLKILALAVFLTGFITSCKDQLDVKNPNEPTLATLQTEKGIIKFATGGIYINGFVDLKYQDGVVGLFWGNGFFDLMADNVGAEAANVFMNQIGCPEKVTYNGGANVVLNPNAPNTQLALIRNTNKNTQAGNNVLYYEWAYMYSLIHSCNFILANVDGITFSGDAATKKSVLKAWALWWKAFAYSRIGSIYVAGLINNDPYGTNGNYKANTEILAEAESIYAQLETLLGGLTANNDYNATLAAIIPDFFQTGKGGVIDPQMWIRNIYTMRARNLMANKTVATMTGADWNNVLTYAGKGIKSSDLVFTGRSNANADILSPLSGTLSAKATGDPKNAATYKISERLIQQFNPTDKRFLQNFKQVSVWVGNVDRGNAFNTRWQLLEPSVAGYTDLGAYVYSDRSPGGYELYMAGSYEENELMKAEANIYLGNTDAGLSSVDAVRTYQGAGLAATSGTGKSQAEAITILRSERRVALLFRSVAFYDARRFGIIDANGGVTNVNVIDNTGTLHTDGAIVYDFMDYWDVPDTELAYNAPAAGSASVVNTKYP